MSHACFVARKTHFHFTTQLPFSGAVFAVKTDFNHHTPQPLQTIFGCPLPRQDACAPRSTGQSFTCASPTRSRQHLQKHFAKNTTCRAAGALPGKPSFRAQLGMCQPAFILCVPCGSTRAFAHQPAQRSHAPHPSKFTCANSPPLARSQHRETRRRSFSCKRTLTGASAARRCRPHNLAGEVAFAQKPPRLARGEAASAERQVRACSNTCRNSIPLALLDRPIEGLRGESPGPELEYTAAEDA